MLWPLTASGWIAKSNLTAPLGFVYNSSSAWRRDSVTDGKVDCGKPTWAYRKTQSIVDKNICTARTNVTARDRSRAKQTISAFF